MGLKLYKDYKKQEKAKSMAEDIREQTKTDPEIVFIYDKGDGNKGLRTFLSVLFAIGTLAIIIGGIILAVLYFMPAV